MATTEKLTVAVSTTKKVTEVLKKGDIVTGANGIRYEITDPIKKTVKKLKSLADLSVDDIEVGEASFTTYQRYLQDRFTEDCPIKKGKLYFRDYRMKFDNEKGFVVEDTRDNYSAVDTPFEGIPTPRELGDWFDKPIKEVTPEAMQKAKRNGEKLLKKEEVIPEVSIEDLRAKVIYTIDKVRNKIEKIDPFEFQQMIPNRKWKVNAGKIIRSWADKKIRYPKMLTMLEELVKDDSTFSNKQQKKIRTDFVGTTLPEFKSVGVLKGTKLEVDNKMIEAVPFLEKYVLHYEPKAMPQLMRFAKGEVSLEQLLKEPIKQDNEVEYNSKLLKGTLANVKALDCLCAELGLVPPQDMLYSEDLKVGDRIKIYLEGKWSIRTITSTDCGVCYGKEIGVLKFDKWYKLETKK